MPQPRTWLADDPDHNLFGRNKPVRWQRPSDPASRALVEAAVHQHEFAKAVRQALRRSGMTTVSLANQAGLTIDQLRRLLRGEAPMTLPQMYLIARHAGVSLASARAEPRTAGE